MDFIMEECVELIKDQNTKDHVKEVISCYQSGNYRASVVLLYSAVIYDLLQKMVLLKEIYKEKTAEDILLSIEEKQKAKSTDSKWEADLIEDICEKTQMITNVEKCQLLNLKNERNYAAHPIFYFDKNNEHSIEKIELRTTTKETAKDLIRKAFEIVFLKDTILAKDIFKELVIDVNEYYNRIGLAGLEGFIKNRYLNRMTQERKNRVFRSLWQVVFISDDKVAEVNRTANYHALQYFYRENPNHYKHLIKGEESHYFEKLKLSTVEHDESIDIYNKIDNFHNSRIMMLIRLIEDNNDIYSVFNDFSRKMIENVAKHAYLKNDISVEKLSEITGVKDLEIRYGEQLKLRAECVFLSNSLQEHLENINNMIDNYCSNKYSYFGNPHYLIFDDEDLIRKIIVQAQYRDGIDKFMDFLIKYCLKASSYSDVAKLFKLIVKFTQYFSKNNFYTCLALMNSNNQCYDNSELSLMLTHLQKQFDLKFQAPLIESSIEQYLYKNLFKNKPLIKSEENFIAVLDIIEQRIDSFGGIWDLWVVNIQNLYYIDTKININFEKKYPNILSKLSDKKDPNYREYYVDAFTGLFEERIISSP